MQIQAISTANQNKKHNCHTSKTTNFCSIQNSKNAVEKEIETVLSDSKLNLAQTQNLLNEFETLKNRAELFIAEGEKIKTKAYSIQDTAKSWYQKGMQTGFKNFKTDDGTIIHFKNVKEDNSHPSLVIEEYSKKVPIKTVLIKDGRITKIRLYNPLTEQTDEYEYYFGLFENYHENVKDTIKSKKTQRSFLFGSNGKLSLVYLGFENFYNKYSKKEESFALSDKEICAYSKNKIESASNREFFESSDKEYSMHFNDWDCKTGTKISNGIRHYDKRFNICQGNLIGVDENIVQNRGNDTIQKRFKYKNNSLYEFASEVNESYPDISASFRMNFKNGTLEAYKINCTGKYKNQTGYVFD